MNMTNSKLLWTVEWQEKINFHNLTSDLKSFDYIWHSLKVDAKENLENIAKITNCVTEYAAAMVNTPCPNIY